MSHEVGLSIKGVSSEMWLWGEAQNLKVIGSSHWFESQHRILDGHIFTLNYCKSYIYVV